MVRFELDKAANKLLVRQSRPLPLAPDEDAIRQSVLCLLYTSAPRTETVQGVVGDLNQIHH